MQPLPDGDEPSYGPLPGANPGASGATAAVLPARGAPPVPRPAAHSERTGLVRGAAATFGGQVITWALTAVTLTLVPRYLGPPGAGVVNIGWTYAGLAATVAGLGLGTLLTREVARNRERIAREIPSAIWLVVALGALASVAATLLAAVIGYSGERVFAVAICTAAVPGVLVSTLCVATLQGLEAMSRAAILDVAGKLITLTMAVLIITVDAGLTGVLVSSALVSYVIAFAQVRMVRRHYHFRLWTLSAQTARRMAVRSLPFFFISVFWVLYTSVDIVMIAHFGTDADVSFYAVPLRVFGAMLFIPVTIATVMYPRLTAVHAADPAALPRMVDQTLRLVVAASIPMALGGIAMSGAGVALILGDGFAEAGPVVTVLAISLIPTAISTVAGRIAFATDRQRQVAVIGFWGFVAKIALGLTLIPLFEARWDNAALGAAVGLVVAEMGMVAVISRFVPHAAFRGPDTKRFYVRLLATTLSATAVLGLLWVVSGPFLGAAAAIVVYCVLVHVLDVYRLSFVRDVARSAFQRSGTSPSPAD